MGNNYSTSIRTELIDVDNTNLSSNVESDIKNDIIFLIKYNKNYFYAKDLEDIKKLVDNLNKKYNDVNHLYFYSTYEQIFLNNQMTNGSLDLLNINTILETLKDDDSNLERCIYTYNKVITYRNLILSLSHSLEDLSVYLITDVKQINNTFSTINDLEESTESDNSLEDELSETSETSETESNEDEEENIKNKNE